MKKKKVFIADHNLMVKEGLAALFKQEDGFDVAGEAENVEDTAARVKKLQPDIVLMEASLPSAEDQDSVARVYSSSQKSRIILTASGLKQHNVRQALQSGAAGYILKTSSFSELLHAINLVMNGDYYLSPEIKTDIIDSFLKQTDEGPSQERYNLLTRREKEVLRIIVSGHTINEVAEMLNISPKTVAKHRASLMEKLEIYNIASLVRYGMKIGLVSG